MVRQTDRLRLAEVSDPEVLPTVTRAVRGKGDQVAVRRNGRQATETGVIGEALEIEELRRRRLAVLDHRYGDREKNCSDRCEDPGWQPTLA
jgi:hypothetical protein